MQKLDHLFLALKVAVACLWQVRIPLYGCDCYAYGLLAAGFCDLVVEADLKPYDYMALVPVVNGAGGLITDWRVSTPLHSLPVMPLAVHFCIP